MDIEIGGLFLWIIFVDTYRANKEERVTGIFFL